MSAFVFVAAGVVVGSLATWMATRGRPEGEGDERAALRAASHERSAELSTVTKRLAVRDEQLAETTKQRDDYKAIASSHTVEYTGWRSGQWVKKVWKDRRYAGHPSRNLEAFVADFAVFADEHVLLTVDIELMGGWKALLGDGGKSAVTEPLKLGRSMLFEGPGQRVLEQLVTFLKDDDTGFIVVGEGGDKQWRDSDSPMNWRFTVDVLQDEQKPVEVHPIEVLRVEREIVERIVEKPVVKTIPPEVANTLCGHTEEEIVTLIEAVLEVRELDQPARLQAERKALPEALGGSPD